MPEPSLSGVEARREIEIDLDGEAPRPDLVRDAHPALADKAIVERLRPMVRTEIERTTWMLRGEEGGRIELDLDVGRITAGGTEVPVCEVELELKNGEPASLFDLALALHDAVPLDTGVPSKAVRGFALLAGAGRSAAKAAAVILEPAMSVERAFRAIARGCVDQIAGNEACVLGGADPEGVHQMRVGVRRLRSALAIFAEALGEAAVSDEMRWLTGELAPARDIDVFLADILAPVEAHFAGDPGLAALRRVAEAARASAYERAREAVRSRRYARLRLALGKSIEGDWRAGADGARAALLAGPAAGFANAVLERHHRRLRKAGRRIETLGPDELHRLRILVKEQRYAVEFFASLHPGRRATRYLRTLRDLQDALGTLNDAEVARSLVARLLEAAPKTGRTRKRVELAAATLAGWHGCTVAGRREPVFAGWHALRAAKPFWR
jgi:inorganic triphosphatase YgiF